MSKSSHQTGVGIGFWSALTLVFIVLKLTGSIDWAWFWVLAPMWAPAALFVAIIGLCIVAYFAFELFGQKPVKPENLRK